MALQKLVMRPGLNREGTIYSSEGGWYDGDKIRFRSGLPEKIGGWTQLAASTFIGVCRSLWIWLDGDSGVGALYIGVGTSAKYYIYSGGIYNDITPYTQIDTLTNPFSTVSGSNSVTVTDGSYNPNVGDYVYFSGATAVGGLTLNGEFIVQTVTSATTYTVGSLNTATSTATGGGTVTASYEYPVGTNIYTIGTGWGAGPWGGPVVPVLAYLGNNPFATTASSATITVTQTTHGMSNGTFVAFSNATAVAGISAAVLNTTYVISGVTTNTYNITLATGLTANATTTGGGSSVVVTEGSGTRGWSTGYSSGVGIQLRLWSNDNFGADLVIAPRGGPIFYWQDSTGVSTRSQSLATLANSTTLLTDATTFSSGSTSITVTSANAPYVYPYSYITGTGIPANTYVTAINNVTGVATISNTTTSASGGNYTYSYSGAFVPNNTYQIITSAVQRFVIAFGANSYSPGTPNTQFNPLLVRWSDQENAYQWVPEITNQSGEYPLSNGSFIMGARATRQEILVWTDSALYSMQYIGAPYVWGFQILMDNISIMSPNCMITLNNITYWMGRDRFYMYNGTVQTLPCALKQYIYDDINVNQAYQVFAGGNEGFNEVWWFYVSNESLNNTVDKYVIYNYLDNIWYYGTFQSVDVTAGSFVAGQQYVIASLGNTNFSSCGAAANYQVGTYFIATNSGSGTGTAWLLNGRTAWLQSGTQPYPIAADYNNRLLNHEFGTDDQATSSPKPIYAYIQSSDFDIGDGNNFGFVWRILPDVNFNGSNTYNTSSPPQITMQLLPRTNSGSAYNTATDAPGVYSVQNYGTPSPSEYTVNQFTGQVYTRLRGRQMAINISSNQLGTAWQLGAPRIDIRQDGRR